MTEQHTNILIVFARLPADGKNKTRLIPALGASGATEVYRQLVTYTLEQVEKLRASCGCQVTIYFTGGSSQQMQTCLGHSWNYLPQSDGDLGNKMVSAIEESLQRGGKKVVVIGTDAPLLQATHLRKAFDALETSDVVIGPADDGGYYLIGMKYPHRFLFSEVEWSTDKVFEQTLRKLKENQLRFHQLEPLADVDYPEDLLVLRKLQEVNAFRSERFRPAADTLSVIIPALNEEKNLRATLASIGRPHRQLEILLADGGSTDETCEIAREWGCRVIEVKQRGRAAQQNAAAAIATGDSLMFLHADTRLPIDYLDAWKAICAQGAVAGAYRLSIDDPAHKYRWLESLVDLRSKWLKLPYGDQALMVKAELFYQLGGFKKLDIMEDYEFVRRVQRHGRLLQMPCAVTTSARRWQKKGIMRTTLVNQLCLLAYHLGVPNRTIAKWYRSKR